MKKAAPPTNPDKGGEKGNRRKGNGANNVEEEPEAEKGGAVWEIY